MKTKKQNQTSQNQNTPQPQGYLRRESLRRLLTIHQNLLQKKYPTLATLADELRTSIKTITRDIAFMRGNMEFPIEFDAHRNGYYYNGPVKAFPGGPDLTEADLIPLVIVGEVVRQHPGIPFCQPLRATFVKLSAYLNTGQRSAVDDYAQALSIRPTAPETINTDLAQMIIRAITDRRVLTFHYRKAGSQIPQLRRVHPYHIFCNDRWYLMAYDPGRAAIRTFALARITCPSVNGQTFRRPADFNHADRLRASFKVMEGQGDYRVVIEFDPWAADMVRGRQWHASQEFTELPGGGAHLSMRLSTLDEVELWILSWGTHATVISPPALADRLKTIAATLFQRYATQSLPSPASTP